jgi:dTMP kinase
MTKFALMGGMIQTLTPGEIGYHNHLNAPTLAAGVIFVYDSTSSGRANTVLEKMAEKDHGAILGVHEGRSGMSYGVPIWDTTNGTKGRVDMKLRSLKQIKRSIRKLIDYINDHPELTFYIPAIGAGTNGYPHRQISALFGDVSRVWVPNVWRRYLETRPKPKSQQEIRNYIATHENFFVITGTDGCGKSTQIEYLREYFKGNDKVLVLTAQESTELGRENRKKLLAGNLTAMQCAKLMHETRIHLINKVIWPALHTGKTVILDRYVDTTLVYQLQQLKDENTTQAKFQQDYRDIRSLCSIAMSALKPCKMIVLDISGEESFRRVKARRSNTPIDQLEADWIEDQDFPPFDARAKSFSEIGNYEIFKQVQTIKIDAMLPREEIFQQLLGHIHS